MTFSHYDRTCHKPEAISVLMGALLYENTLILSGSEVKAETIAFPREDTAINAVKTDA